MYHRIFAWTKDFVSSSMKFTKVQCWIRIHGLPMKYWKPKSIFFIVKEIDIRLSLSEYTMNKSIGFLLECWLILISYSLCLIKYWWKDPILLLLHILNLRYCLYFTLHAK